MQKLFTKNLLKEPYSLRPGSPREKNAFSSFFSRGEPGRRLREVAFYILFEPSHCNYKAFSRKLRSNLVKMLKMHVVFF